MRRRTFAAVAFLVSVAAAALLLIGGFAAPAQAHAELVSTEPSAAEPLATCPHRLTLRFGEAVADGGLRVSVNGRAATATSATAEVFEIDAYAFCPAARLALTWRTVSADDGHVATGAVTFHVRTAAPATASEPQTSQAGPHGAALPVFRVLGYVAVALLVGGVFFLVVVWPEGADERRSRALLALSVALGLAAAAGGLWATTERAGGMSLRVALDQPFGREYAALGVLWVLATVLVVELRQRGRAVLGRLAWRVSCVLVGGAIVVVESMTAHAFASNHRMVGLADDVVHVSAMSVWIGGLLMLTVCVLPRRRLAELDTVVPRFSRVAKRSVGVVVLSGLVLFALVVLPAHHLWGSRYGATLGIKLAVLAAALVVALGSERWVRGRRLGTRADDLRSVTAIVASVSAETVLALLVLAAAGVLASSSPGT